MRDIPLGFVPIWPGRKVGYVINLETGCWDWVGAKRSGYGAVGREGRVIPAHRAFYEAMRGSIPGHLELDHLCRNRGCVNPTHLEAVTRAVNVQRGNRTSLTAAQVADIRRRYRSGESKHSIAAEFSVTPNYVVCLSSKSPRTWKPAALPTLG